MIYVLLHGWGGSKKSMESLAELLRKGDGKAITYDLPGFGDEPNPPLSWGIDEYANFVEKQILVLIQNDNKEKVILIGHSFGGAISLKIASKNPVWLAKIVVIAPSWKRPNQDLRSKNYNLRNQFKKFIPNSMKRLIYKIFFSKSDLYLRPDLESNYRKIVTQDLSMEVKNITLPTLILWGDQDSYVPVAQGKELNHLVQNSQLVILPAGRHGLPFQNPLWIVEQMKEHGFF